MTTLSIALAWHDIGVCPIPCHPHTKAPAIRWSRWMTKLPPRSLISSWFSRPRNLALVTGGPANLLVLDFDDIDRYRDWQRDIHILSYTTATPRGRHVYLHTKSTSTMQLQGIDVKAARSCVLAPPSIHPCGQPYEVISNIPIIWVDSLNDALPQWQELVTPAKIPASPPHSPTESSSLISQIRSNYPLLTLLSRYTTPIPSSQDNRWYVMCCPHPRHHDTNPSFWCDSWRHICGCFKQECQRTQPNSKPMDVINFYAWLHGITNREAIQELSR